MKRHARSLALRETQIAAAAIRYYLFIRVAKVETATPPSKCWRGCGETGSLTHCRWERNVVQPLWKRVRQFLKTTQVQLPCHPATGHPGIYPRETKTYIHTRM